MSKLVSDSDRQAAAQDVVSEIFGLIQAWQRHRSDGLAWTAWFVHARNLMHFFDSISDHRNELLARDFFDPPSTWDAIRPQVSKPEDYSAVELAANELAAHMTLGRAGHRARGGQPPSEEVTQYLLLVGEGFVGVLPKEHRESVRGEWLRRLTDNAT